METQVAYGGGGLLLEQSQPSSSSQWQLDGDRMAIGRDPRSDIFVNDTCISRHHADLIRDGLTWSIIDARSTNGTFVNGRRVREAVALRPQDRIRLGEVELVVRQPGYVQPGYAPAPDYGATQGVARPAGRVPEPAPAPSPAPAPPAGGVNYDVGWQQGNISNIAGNQANYYRESNLRFIASRRGRARVMIIWGVSLWLIGAGIGAYAVLNFDRGIFDAIGSQNPAFPKLSPLFFPMVGLSVLLSLVGVGLLIFGLIARSGAKREARRLRAEW